MSAESVIYQRGKWIRYGIMVLGALLVFASLQSVFDLYSTYRQLNLDLSMTDRTPQIRSENSPARAFEKIDINRTIFEAISEAAKQNNVIVRQISPPLVVKENGYLLQTEEVTLEGDFVRILRCMDVADKKLGAIKIASLRFERFESAKSNTLMLRVFFQLVNIDDDES